MGDCRHQCRYCAYCVFTMDEDWWCDELDKFVKNPKRPNKCEKWLFNEIPADGPLDKKYKPRKKSPFKQEKLFAMPTDKQATKKESE